MTVTSVRKDPEARRMTITAGLDATVERLAACGRTAQLERWWGPPTYPATSWTTTSRPEGGSPTS